MNRRSPPTMLLCATLLVAAPSPATAADPCAAWPGEPSPLPDTRHDDLLLAHWAEMRGQELAATAERFEAAGHVATAHRLWRHALCLDPGREAWRLAAERTEPVHAHRPEVARVERTVPPLPAERVEQVLARLGEVILVVPRREAPEPVTVRRAPSPPPVAANARPAAPDREAASPPPASPTARAPTPAPAPALPSAPAPAPAELEPSPLEQVDAGLAEVRSLVAAARFEDALERLAGLREALASAGEGADVRDRQARLEVLAGTAALALQRDAEARQSFARALEADPSLRLDPATTSPKVVRAFERVREGTP